MRNTLIDFKTGWYGIELTLSPEEIDILIGRLNDLKSGRSDHFHLVTENWTPTSGIADVEISIKGDDEIDNTRIW